jgi:transposase
MDAIFYVLRSGCQWKALDATRCVPKPGQSHLAAVPA